MTAVEIGLNAVFVVLGAFIGLFLGEYVRRPNIRVDASGAGLTPAGFSVVTITITNTPGRAGIAIGQSILFGRTIFRGRQWGPPITRSPALVSASLLNDKGQGVGLLLESLAAPGRFDGQVKIENDGHARIYLFARLESEPDRYFIYGDDGHGQPEAPPDYAKLRGDHEFTLRVSYGTTTKLFPVSVSMHLQGTLWVQSAGGGMSF